jgi:hypothetical protein
MGFHDMKAYHPSKDAPNPGVLSMQSQERDQIATFFEDTVSSGASSQDVAEAVVAAFRGIDEALKSVLGQRGVAALYMRTLHLASQVHPWLPVVQESVPTEVDVSPLATLLAQQTAVEASAAGIQLLQGFCALLTGLIGPSLTERLLRSVWATILSGPTDRGTTS